MPLSVLIPDRPGLAAGHERGFSRKRALVRAHPGPRTESRAERAPRAMRTLRPSISKVSAHLAVTR